MELLIPLRPWFNRAPVMGYKRIRTRDYRTPVRQSGIGVVTRSTKQVQPTILVGFTHYRVWNPGLQGSMRGFEQRRAVWGP